MTEQDAGLAALKNYRDGQFAGLVTVLVGLAAETHPEELQQALSRVFDLSAVEESAKQAAERLRAYQSEATQVHRLVGQLKDEAVRLEDKVERLRDEAARVGEDAVSLAVLAECQRRGIRLSVNEHGRLCASNQERMGPDLKGLLNVFRDAVTEHLARGSKVNERARTIPIKAKGAG